MSFTSLILKNLLRQRIRTTLTVIGIAIGITTVIALGLIVGGMKQTAGALTRAYGADFFVAQAGSSDLSFSVVNSEQVQAIDRYPGVEHSMGVLLRISRVSGNPFFVTIGVRPADLRMIDLRVVEGRLPADDAVSEILLGSDASGRLGAGVGDTVVIDDRDFTVVGIYKSDNLWEDGGAMAPLATVQEIAGRPDLVTMVYVWAEDGVDPKELATSIRDDMPLLTTVADTGDYGEVDQGMEIVDAVYLAISALAVGIGAIGVMNTMVMSVFERTREIGILRAVGWSDNRIVRLIVGESLILCLVAAVFGSILGVLAAQAVTLIPAVQSLLEPAYDIEVFIRGFVVAGIVALIGAIYPVVRAIRLQPMEALRHE